MIMVDKPLSPLLLLLVPVNRKQLKIKNTVSGPHMSAI